MKPTYSREKNAQIVLALLKAHGIRKVVASPGATNVALVASMQGDPFFEMYSAVDERSAAYIACGLADEANEPVVLSCTGATASRNYFPGITEAYYRKLPILAITSSQATCRIGHNIAQVIDRSNQPNDTYKFCATLPIVKDDEDIWECEIKINKAILELTRDGGGPAHLNLPTAYDLNYDVETLPASRVIRRITDCSSGPTLPKGKVAVVVGSHRRWSEGETTALEKFCSAHNAVVMCDHTSGYKGKFRVLSALLGGQNTLSHSPFSPDIVIRIGDVSGDYYGLYSSAKEVWRVSEDGEIRDQYRKLSYIFAMPERNFFEAYSDNRATGQAEYHELCVSELERLRSKIPKVPFSNVWLASQMAHRIPGGSTVHFAILNSLRTWNFFDLPATVDSSSNVGGFGIDGAVSTIIGASLAKLDKLYYGVIGDLAFFYDINALGNRHLGNNVRILLVNNGKGTEFRQYGHHASHFGDKADEFIAASGHFGCQSPVLVKNYAENLGCEYFTASDEASFLNVFERFLVPEITDRPMVFEVFTNSMAESKALEMMLKINPAPPASTQDVVKGMAKRILGEKGTEAAKKWMKP
jgi:2-succinyl-5-enolpyruvyl-6-hydroxy-3-cyclohexene-1-carboxylate synthase